MAGKHDMKEFEEFKEGLKKLTVFVAARASDGVDLSDGYALGKELLFNEKFRNIMIEAINGIQKIPQELKAEIEIDGIEGLLEELL